MSLADWIQSIGIFVAFIGIIVAIYYSRKQVKELNEILEEIMQQAEGQFSDWSA